MVAYILQGVAPLEEAPDPAALRSEIELRQMRNEGQWRFRAIVGIEAAMALSSQSLPNHAGKMRAA